MKLTQKQLRRIISEVLAERGPALPRPRSAVGRAALSHGDLASDIADEVLGHMEFDVVTPGSQHDARDKAQDFIYDQIVQLLLSVEDELGNQGVGVHFK